MVPDARRNVAVGQAARAHRGGAPLMHQGCYLRPVVAHCLYTANAWAAVTYRYHLVRAACTSAQRRWTAAPCTKQAVRARPVCTHGQLLVSAGPTLNHDQGNADDRHVYRTLDEPTLHGVRQKLYQNSEMQNWTPGGLNPPGSVQHSKRGKAAPLYFLGEGLRQTQLRPY